VGGRDPHQRAWFNTEGATSAGAAGKDGAGLGGNTGRRGTRAEGGVVSGRGGRGWMGPGYQRGGLPPTWHVFQTTRPGNGKSFLVFFFSGSFNGGGMVKGTRMAEVTDRDRAGLGAGMGGEKRVLPFRGRQRGGLRLKIRRRSRISVVLEESGLWFRPLSREKFFTKLLKGWHYQVEDDHRARRFGRTAKETMGVTLIATPLMGVAGGRLAGWNPAAAH